MRWIVLALACALLGFYLTQGETSLGGGETAAGGPRYTRILPGSAGAVDVLFDLVEPERVVALPAEAFAYSALADKAEIGWSTLPRMRAFSGEEILALGPDLVIVHAWQAGHTVDALRASGIPVVQLGTFEDWQSLRAPIEQLGEMLEVEEGANALLESLEERRARLAERTGARELSGLAYGNYGAGGSTAGKGTTTDLVLRLAGARNAAAEAGIAGHAPIDFERILSLEPDFFLLGEDPAGGLNPSVQLLREAPALAGLEAIREDRLLVMPIALYSTASHRLLDAAEWLAERL